MKLQSITIEGFWGYREQVFVEIDGLPLLVAVGQNGSGKSALAVSAVLAGLYGKFPTRTVEESITTGAASGTIIIELDVAGSTYRVARTHQRSGTASASVFRMVDGSGSRSPRRVCARRQRRSSRSWGWTTTSLS